MGNEGEPGDYQNLSNYTNSSLLCGCESVLALNASEFEYVEGNNVSLNGLCLEVWFNTSQGLPVICEDELPHEHTRFEILSYVGNSLSILCCCLLLLTLRTSYAFCKTCCQYIYFCCAVGSHENCIVWWSVQIF